VMVSSAQAAERWPDNVCREVATIEKLDSKVYAGRPAALALARNDVLLMLQERCGVDVKAKMAADDAASRTADAAPAAVPPAVVKQHMNCVTLKLDRDLATTNCD